ncbi:AbiV family abortive infection protein [Vibrio splendidus]
MSKDLKQWKNMLNAEQIAHGMNLATANSVRLLKDAEILFEAGSYPTAFSLAVLAIEEAGKVSILRELAVARDGKEVKEAWRAYRSHTRKNVMWLFPSLVQSGSKTLSEFKALFSDDADHPMMLDDLKQIGFYTDCLGTRHWSVPDEIIDKMSTKNILSVARVLCKERSYSKREIELWIKHIKPVWKSPTPLMQDALKYWYKQMVKEGLAAEGAMSFDEFID